MTYEEVVAIMNEEFNYNLDFKSWAREEYQMVGSDYKDGETEYQQDEQLTQ